MSIPFPTPAPTPSPTPIGPPSEFDMAVDTDVSGNTAMAIGQFDPCVSLTLGQSVDVDIVLKGIPAPGVAGVDLDLLYNPAVVSVQASDPNFILSGVGHNLQNFSDPAPSNDGDQGIHLVDLGGTYRTGDGVVVRLTFKAVGAGDTSLALDDLIENDSTPNVYGVDQSNKKSLFSPSWATLTAKSR
jgi:Cohesin domain